MIAPVRQSSTRPLPRVAIIAVVLATCAATALPASAAQSSAPSTLPASKSPISTAADQKTIKEFQTRVAGYIKIKQHAPSQAHLKRSSDVHEIELRREQLKEVIRKARPNAKQGDIFTASVSSLFRRLLANALNGPNGEKLRESLKHAEPVASADPEKLKIDDDFPNKTGEPLQSSPVTLLENLPLLPKTLEYRLVGTTLVLRDSEANLVVDYLRNAVQQ